MNPRYLLFLCLLISGNLLANINHIDISKISYRKNLIELFNYVKENHPYYSHWTSNWNYDKSKSELEVKLREAFRTFASLPVKNDEVYLLLGDIAHYLYNLDVTVYNDSALINYKKAMTISPGDFRCHWFLGVHYAQSNLITKGIANLLLAERVLSSPQPADFWEDYVWATAIANMPSHALYGMDKVRELTGKAGMMEEQMGVTIHNRMVDLNKDSSYRREKIWHGVGGNKPTFTSRPLGVKLSLDPKSQLNVLDYAKRTGVAIVKPPAIKNKAGIEIHFTIALLVRVADETDKLEDYLLKMMTKGGKKWKIKFSDKYEQITAYEIKDKTMYRDSGGGHLYMVGLERNAPKYPGFILEDPINLPSSAAKNEVSYYSPPEFRNRFKGRIFYALILDSCEDIHTESFAVFKYFFENQLVIE